MERNTPHQLMAGPHVPTPKLCTRVFTLMVFGLLLMQSMNLSAQNEPSLGAEFATALEGLPEGKELDALPAESQSQVRETRKIYQKGIHVDGMSNSEVIQLSLRLKANTAKSRQLIAMLDHADCIQLCLQERTRCKNKCPESIGLTCRCCIRCYLKLDICVTNCLLGGHKPVLPPTPRISKQQRNKR